MKLTIALLLASIPLLVLGGEGVYHAALSRQPYALTCEQLVAQPPRTSWLEISGCQLGEDVRYQETGGEITELAFPVRQPGQPHSEPAVMLAVTRDPEVLAIAQEAIGNGQQPDEEARTVMMLRVLTALDAATEIDGFARRGLLQTVRTHRTLASAHVPLVPGGMVLDLNERPSFVLPAVLAGTGVVLLLLVMARLLQPEEPKQPRAARPDEEAAAAAAWEAPISRLLLLNLAPSAGREAIEQAPPLGPREEVEERITRAIAGVTFDAGGRGTLVSDGSSVVIELGADPMVWTAVLNAQGPGARGALRALTEETGWRLYAPKRGTFLDIHDLDQL